MKLFTVNSYYLPLIEKITANNYDLPLMRSAILFKIIYG